MKETLVFVDVYTSNEWLHIFPLLPGDGKVDISSSGSRHGLLIGSLITEEDTLQMLLGVRKKMLTSKATAGIRFSVFPESSRGYWQRL